MVCGDKVIYQMGQLRSHRNLMAPSAVCERARRLVIDMACAADDLLEEERSAVRKRRLLQARLAGRGGRDPTLAERRGALGPCVHETHPGGVAAVRSRP